jgi:hypothetical protein
MVVCVPSRFNFGSPTSRPVLIRAIYFNFSLVNRLSTIAFARDDKGEERPVISLTVRT